MNRPCLFMLLLSITLTSCASPPAPEEATVSASIPPTSIPPTPTATTVPTRVLTPTPAPTLTYTLSGTVFFDHNGNGFPDGGEPPIEGVRITVGTLTAITGVDGFYTIEGAPAGDQRVSVESPSQDPATAFRYTSLSLDAFQATKEPIPITVGGDTTLDIALMQGFMTSPFPCQTEWQIGCYQNLLDAAEGCRTWAGNSELCGADHVEGIDFAVPRGTTTTATAPGTVEAVVDQGELGFNVIVEHECLEGVHRQSTYGHLVEAFVTAGKQVQRGQPIGLTGDYGRYPHLHFGFYVFTRDASGYATPIPGQSRIAVDPYRDVTDSNSTSYWTVDNDPHCLPQETDDA